MLHERRCIRRPLRRRAVAVVLLVLLLLLHLPLICALLPPPLLLLVLLPPLLARVGPLELRPLYLQGNHRLPAQEGFAHGMK